MYQKFILPLQECKKKKKSHLQIKPKENRKKKITKRRGEYVEIENKHVSPG